MDALFIRKKLLLVIEKIKELVNLGACDDCPDEAVEKISNMVIPPETMGREKAAEHFGISLNHFHDLVRNNIIPQPKKIKGLKEKQYYLSDLLNVPKEKICKHINNH